MNRRKFLSMLGVGAVAPMLPLAKVARISANEMMTYTLNGGLEWDNQGSGALTREKFDKLWQKCLIEDEYNRTRMFANAFTKTK